MRKGLLTGRQFRSFRRRNIATRKRISVKRALMRGKYIVARWSDCIISFVFNTHAIGGNKKNVSAMLNGNTRLSINLMRREKKYPAINGVSGYENEMHNLIEQENVDMSKEKSSIRLARKQTQVFEQGRQAK